MIGPDLQHDADIHNSFITQVKNRFSTLQEVEIIALSANTRYNNFVKKCLQRSRYKCNYVKTKTKKETILRNSIYLSET